MAFSGAAMFLTWAWVVEDQTLFYFFFFGKQLLHCQSICRNLVAQRMLNSVVNIPRNEPVQCFLELLAVLTSLQNWILSVFFVVSFSSLLFVFLSPFARLGTCLVLHHHATRHWKHQVCVCRCEGHHSAAEFEGVQPSVGTLDHRFPPLLPFPWPCHLWGQPAWQDVSSFLSHFPSLVHPSFPHAMRQGSCHELWARLALELCDVGATWRVVCTCSWTATVTWKAGCL